MSTIGHDFVAPRVLQVGEVGTSDGGLTKREYFAALALSGLVCSTQRVSANSDSRDHKRVAEISVQLADALIQNLNRFVTS